MLKQITHITLMVRDQDEAAAYFIDKLGLEKRMDSPMENMGTGARWVTLGLPGQPDLEIILQPPTWGPGGENAAERSALVGKSGGFIFRVEDCRQSYADLKAKGVVFEGEPMDFPWGIQAVFNDLYGNTHLLSQDPPAAG